MMSYFHEWILVVGIISCHGKTVMKEKKKETIINNTYEVARKIGH